MCGHDPPHDRLVDRVPALVRPAHLDPYDIAALRGGHHDRRIAVAAALAGLAGRVHPGHVRDQVGERGRDPVPVHLGLDGRRVDGELHAARTDQLDGPVDARRDDGVDQDLLLREPVPAGVQALVAEDVVHQRGHP